ncbi:MAG: GGDEF domain-containing protein [Azonexus sp.]
MTTDTRANIRLAQLHLYVDIHLHDRYLAPPLALVVAALLTNWVPVAWAAAWAGAELLIIANYIRVYRAFKRSNATPRDEPRWARRIAIAHGAHMLAWSSLVFWAWQPGSFPSLVFIMLVHIGLISLTTSMSNAHLRILAFDMIFPILALLGPPLLEFSWFNVGLCLLGAGFSALMLLVARQINAYSTEALQLRQRNDILIRELESQASRDSLTGLVNRRYFLAEANRQIQAAQRSPQVLALMIIDLDHFKQVNDQYGHLGGDEVLVAVVDALSRHLRTGDWLGRLGGEEFALLLPETTQAEAMETAERLRQATAALHLDIQGHPVNPTVSIGIALLDKEDLSLSNLMHRADLAMYAAKTQGRNRVVCATPAVSPEMVSPRANTAAIPV